MKKFIKNYWDEKMEEKLGQAENNCKNFQQPQEFTLS